MCNKEEAMLLHNYILSLFIVNDNDYNNVIITFQIRKKIIVIIKLLKILELKVNVNFENYNFWKQNSI